MSYKKLLGFTTLGLAIIFGTLMAMGESPIPPWFQDYLSSDPSLMVKDLGLSVKRTAHGKYKFASNGGGTTGTAIPLGITLPATAAVQRSYYYVTTGLTYTGGADGHNQVGCDTGAHFKSRQLNFPSAASFVEGTQTGTAATMTSSTTSCAVSLSVATHSITAGEFDIFIDYVMPK